MNANDFVKFATTNHMLKNGRWVPTQPLPLPFWMRVKAAWKVLTGKAEAVTFD